MTNSFQNFFFLPEISVSLMKLSGLDQSKILKSIAVGMKLFNSHLLVHLSSLCSFSLKFVNKN